MSIALPVPAAAPTRKNPRPLALTRLLTRQRRAPVDPKVGLLRSLGLFEGVPDRFLATLVPLVDHLDLPAGERLLTEGAVAAEAFLLVEGAAQATLRGRPVGLAHAGELLGDLALLSSGRSPLTWVATTDVALLVMAPRELRELLHRCPVVADRLHGLVAVPANAEPARA